jgi:hypothetical protein
VSPLDWIKALLGKGIVEPVANYYTRKQELKQARFEATLKAEQAAGDRRAKLISEGISADAAWELKQIENSGWKDEWVLVLLSIPLAGCFIPGVDAYILRGFAILDKCPDWYRWLIVTVFLAIYGIRWWRREQQT